MRDVFLAFLRLGLTSFGGPIAHLGYFREEFVVRRGWLDEEEYAELVALCQFLPGPASSQVGMAIGLQRAGLPGALAAWCGFTLPSALLMIGLALGLSRWGDGVPAGVLHGMKLLAVAVVAQAVWGMARTFCRDGASIALALLCAALLAGWPHAWMQLAVIGLGAAVGMLTRGGGEAAAVPGFAPVLSRRAGLAALALFALLLALPLLGLPRGSALDVFAMFYRAGSLVFGGGHVVMPLLQSGVVAPGWIPQDAFLAGYGAVQAVPGPLFTFAAFLGAGMDAGPGGWWGGWLALAAIFLPSLLLVLGVLPFWRRVRAWPRMRAALAGVNAAVVGLLLAALYDPVWTGAVAGPWDAALAGAALFALTVLRWPVGWVIVGVVLAAWVQAG